MLLSSLKVHGACPARAPSYTGCMGRNVFAPGVLLALSVLVAVVSSQERPLPDYETFAARVKEQLATDEERQSGYVFLERRTEQ